MTVMVTTFPAVAKMSAIWGSCY